MSSVARVGSTVRRASGAWTARVHALLAHLRAQGIHEVPEPLGFDEQGREILSYLPGLVGHQPTPQLLSESVLVSAGRLLRRIHDATAEVAQAWPDGWQARPRAPVEVICHGDFAPYNCVFAAGRLIGVIDFDHAHPGSRAWDLAYALYRFAPLQAPSNPDTFGTLAEQARRARLFCDAYGLADRSQVCSAVHRRIQSMADFLREGEALGDPQRIANIQAGHLAIYVNDAAYVAEAAEELNRALS